MHEEAMIVFVSMFEEDTDQPGTPRSVAKEKSKFFYVQRDRKNESKVHWFQNYRLIQLCSRQILIVVLFPSSLFFGYILKRSFYFIIFGEQS